MRLTSAYTARRRGASTFTDQGLDRNGQVGWLTGWLASSAGRKSRNRLYVCASGAQDPQPCRIDGH